MKSALLSTATDLLKTLDFLDDDQRQEIMFRNKSSREPLGPGMAWKRMKKISQDIDETILPKARELIEDFGSSSNNGNNGKNHEEVCEMLLQSMFEEQNGTSQCRPHPPLWEFNNNKVALTIYRIYYRGDVVDPNISLPTCPAAIPAPNKRAGDDDSLSSAPQFDDSVVLTEEQQLHFINEGYIHVKNVVPAKLVHAALGQINAALCTYGANVSIDDDGSNHYCPGVGRSEAILNLLKLSPVWTLAQRLLGKGNIQDIQRAQIALRPPQPHLIAAGGPERTDGSLPPRVWHIDGTGTGNHSTFSLLVGITLSDVLQPNCGNFSVFPGSHRKLLPLLKEQVESGSSLFSNENSTKKPALHNGVQILAEAGDAVLVHHKTAHRGVPNSSHAIRYQVYFRLRHKSHARNIESGVLLDDLFVEYEGLSNDLL